MTNTIEKQPLRPLMKQVKTLFAQWRLEQNLVEPGDFIKPPSNNYPTYKKADGTIGTRVHIGFAAAEPPVEEENVRAFAEWLSEHPDFTGTVIHKEFAEEGKKSHRYLLITPAEASDATDEADETSVDAEDDGRAAPLFGGFPTLTHLPAPTQFLRG